MSKMGYKCNKNKCFPPSPSPVCGQLAIQDRRYTPYPPQAMGSYQECHKERHLRFLCKETLNNLTKQLLPQGKLVDVLSELDKTRTRQV